MNKKTRWASAVAALAIAFALGACSSSKKNNSNNDHPPDDLPPEDAGTDALPSGEVEPGTGASNSAAPDAAPADPNTAPGGGVANDSVASSGGEAAAAGGTGNEVASSGGGTPFQGTGQFQPYTVQDGDTLMKIAFESYGDIFKWRKIYKDNKDVIKNPHAVPPGTQIKIEGASSPISVSKNGEKYLIKPGDTLGTISGDVYGTPKKWKKIWKNNPELIKDPNRIFAGFYLYYTVGPDDQKSGPTTSGAPLANGGAPAGGGGSPSDPSPVNPDNNTASGERVPASEGDNLEPAAGGT